MTNDRIIGLVFIAFGTLALLSWLGGGSLIWLGALAALFIYLYIQQRSYGFLLAGGLLAGLAVGILLGGSMAAILLSLGASFFVIDRIEAKTPRWPLYVAVALAALGLLFALGQIGFLSSLWFALILVAVGIFLLLRKNQQGWTYTRAATSSPLAAGVTQTSTPATPPAPSPTEADASPASDVAKHALQPQAPASTTHPPATETPEDSAEEAAEEAAGEVKAPPLRPEEQALYGRLESWRRQQAAEEAKPAYIILTNESLLQIAREKPGSLDELRKTKGIGPVKLERYGETILTIVQESA